MLLHLIIYRTQFPSFRLFPCTVKTDPKGLKLKWKTYLRSLLKLLLLLKIIFMCIRGENRVFTKTHFVGIAHKMVKVNSTTSPTRPKEYFLPKIVNNFKRSYTVLIVQPTKSAGRPRTDQLTRWPLLALLDQGTATRSSLAWLSVIVKMLL